jgi:hypothetical protein
MQTLAESKAFAALSSPPRILAKSDGTDEDWRGGKRPGFVTDGTLFRGNE